MFFRNYYNLNKFINNLKTFDNMFLNNIPDVKGKEIVERGVDENGEWEKKTFVSDDGSFTYSYYTNNPSPLKNESDLESKLQEAINRQDFESAVLLRDEIKSMEVNKDKLTQLQKELDDTIQNQNFEKSIVLRDKINKLKTKK